MLKSEFCGFRIKGTSFPTMRCQSALQLQWFIAQNHRNASGYSYGNKKESVVSMLNPRAGSFATGSHIYSFSNLSNLVSKSWKYIFKNCNNIVSDTDVSKIINPVASKQQRKLVWLITKSQTIDCTPLSDISICKVASESKVKECWLGGKRERQEHRLACPQVTSSEKCKVWKILCNFWNSCRVCSWICKF